MIGILFLIKNFYIQIIYKKILWFPLTSIGTKTCTYKNGYKYDMLYLKKQYYNIVNKILGD